MQGTIGRWGNSLAMRLPRHIADRVQFYDGTTVSFEIDGNALRIVPDRKKLNLRDLLVNEPAIAAGDGSQEVDWGSASGREVW